MPTYFIFVKPESKLAYIFTRRCFGRYRSFKIQTNRKSADRKNLSIEIIQKIKQTLSSIIRHFPVPSMHMHLKLKTVKFSVSYRSWVESKQPHQHPGGFRWSHHHLLFPLVNCALFHLSLSLSLLFNLGVMDYSNGPESRDSTRTWRDTGVMVAACWGDTQILAGENNSHRMAEKREWREGGVGEKKGNALYTAEIMFWGFLNVTLINKSLWQ